MHLGAESLDEVHRAINVGTKVFAQTMRFSGCSPSGQSQRYAPPWKAEDRDTTHGGRFAGFLGKGMVVTDVPWILVKANDRVGDPRKMTIFRLFLLDNPFGVGIFFGEPLAVGPRACLASSRGMVNRRSLCSTRWQLGSSHEGLDDGSYKCR
jgi:hypothetical protein